MNPANAHTISINPTAMGNIFASVSEKRRSEKYSSGIDSKQEAIPIALGQRPLQRLGLSNIDWE